jgi:hypothetical protein
MTTFIRRVFVADLLLRLSAPFGTQIWFNRGQRSTNADRLVRSGMTVE